MSNTPPKLFKRNEFGLIDDESISYVFNEDGSVNWRKMVKPEFLVPNKQAFERRGKQIPESIEGLEDRDLIILLGGIKDLAALRGYSEVRHTVQSPAADCIISSCAISWLPNYETENRPVTFSAIGDATPFNTTNFGKNFLGACAENRAFVRAVRNFLKVNIVGQDELGGTAGPTQDAPETDQTSATLLAVMAAHNVSFEKVKSTLVKEQFPGAELFTRVEDIPNFKKFELIERIKKAVSNKEKPEPA
jgi:hypothetical protein